MTTRRRIPFPTRSMFDAQTTHDGCTACDQAAANAANMARCTGSVGSSYDDGRGHKAVVRREIVPGTGVFSHADWSAYERAMSV